MIRPQRRAVLLSRRAAGAWPVAVPLLAIGVLAVAAALPVSVALLVLLGVVLVCAVISAVHHAEVVAHRIGEPFGTLVLALAVTGIETALVLSMMVSGGQSSATVARDAILAAVMIGCNGVLGLCILVGGLRHREQNFRVQGAGSGLAALATLCALVLVAPTLTVSAAGSAYTKSQLLFAALASLILWLTFIFIQTIRHRDYFLPAQSTDDIASHAPPPDSRAAWLSLVFLVVSLLAVVGLAKKLSPAIERSVIAAHLPVAVVGVVIAVIVMLPETGAAVRAAHANRLQSSLNLAIGAAMACIGLTVPLVVAAALALDLTLVLGLEATEIALLALTFVVSAFTLGSGLTNMMYGVIHIVIFAAFLFFTFVP